MSSCNIESNTSLVVLLLLQGWCGGVQIIIIAKGIIPHVELAILFAKKPKDEKATSKKAWILRAAIDSTISIDLSKGKSTSAFPSLSYYDGNQG